MNNYKYNNQVFLNLIENSNDFLLNAVDILKTNKNQGYGFPIFNCWDGFYMKIAFLSISTAIELLLKSIIAHNNWRVIFKDESNASMNSIKTGNFESIDFANCASKLKSEFGIKICSREKRIIDKLRKERNKLMHYCNDEINQNYIMLISLGINVYQNIYFKFVASFDVKNRIDAIDYSLIEIPEYVKIRKESLLLINNLCKPQSSFFNICKQCNLENTIVFMDDKNYTQCLYCKYVEHIEESATFLGKRGDLCPICNRNTVLLINEQDGTVVRSLFNCINCNHKVYI
jgi:hypothetical protein